MEVLLAFKSSKMPVKSKQGYSYLASLGSMKFKTNSKGDGVSVREEHTNVQNLNIIWQNSSIYKIEDWGLLLILILRSEWVTKKYSFVQVGCWLVERMQDFQIEDCLLVGAEKVGENRQSKIWSSFKSSSLIGGTLDFKVEDRSLGPVLAMGAE